MSDLISRQEVKEILRTEWVKLFPVELDPYLSLAMEKIENIPSAEKTGKWERSDDTWKTAICSICKLNTFARIDYAKKHYKFCPFCGAKMEVTE